MSRMAKDALSILFKDAQDWVSHGRGEGRREGEEEVARRYGEI